MMMMMMLCCRLSLLCWLAADRMNGGWMVGRGTENEGNLFPTKSKHYFDISGIFQCKSLFMDRKAKLLPEMSDDREIN
jgi:hypothetical protein